MGERALINAIQLVTQNGYPARLHTTAVADYLVTALSPDYKDKEYPLDPKQIVR